nr:malate dehydrogenase 1b [Hymenolepis microstoma]
MDTGSADCPFYAACEALGDSLNQNWPDFHVTKHVIAPEEWDKYSESLCKEHGWPKMCSPIIWRELVDTGGRVTLIGDANDFQEYTNTYYAKSSQLSSKKLLQIDFENQCFVNRVKAALAIKQEQRNSWKKLAIIGAESPTAARLALELVQIQYADPKIKMKLHLVPSEIEYQQAVDALKGILEDCAFIGSHAIGQFSNLPDALDSASLIVILDVVPRKIFAQTENRIDWLKRRFDYFTSLGENICKYADSNARVVVAGSAQIFEGSEMKASPLNFDVQTLHKACKGRISSKNIVGIPRALEYFVKGALGSYFGVNRCDVVDLILWGNIDNAFFVDLSKTRVYRRHGPLDSETGPAWFNVTAESIPFKPEEFYGKILPEKFEKMKSSAENSAAMIHAAAIFNFIRQWEFWEPDQRETISSLVVSSCGQYDIPSGLAFSFPVSISSNGCFEILQDIPMDHEKSYCIARCVLDALKDWSVIDPSMLNEYQKYLDSIANIDLDAYFLGVDSFIPKDEDIHIISPESIKNQKLTAE